MPSIEIEREEDGRWIGEVPELPCVLTSGGTEAEACAPRRWRAASFLIGWARNGR
jgi:hypothetical protein